MRIELLQFIVPLAFLAIWALTSLLNRDTQPLPPRNGRGAGFDGPRSGRADGIGMGRDLAAGRTVGAAGGRNVAQGGRVPGRPGTMGGRPLGPDDAIVFLGPDGRAVSVPASSSSAFSPSASVGNRAGREGAASTRRAPSRSKARQKPSGLTSIEPEQPRALTGLVAQPLTLNKARPLSIAPLSMPIAPLSSPLTREARSDEHDRPPTRNSQPRPALTSDELRSMLASPEKLREMAVISEVLLRPPVALRSRAPRLS